MRWRGVGGLGAGGLVMNLTVDGSCLWSREANLTPPNSPLEDSQVPTDELLQLSDDHTVQTLGGGQRVQAIQRLRQ